MKILCALVLVTLMAGCSTVEKITLTAAEEAASKGYDLGEPVKGIHNYDINGWQYVSPTSLIIPSRPSHYYLLMLDRPCRDLRSTEVIVSTSTVNQLLAGFDSILVRSRPGGILDRCRVTDIYTITKAKKAKDAQAAE